MKTLIKFFLSVVICSFLLSSVHGRVLFEPVDAGQASGSSFYTFGGAFDDQPNITDLPTSGFNTVSGSTLGSSVPSFASDNGIRVGYIDFGENYSQVQIIELWTAYRNFSNYDGNQPFLDLWWADSSTLTTENIAGVNTVQKPAASTTDITNPDFNFGTQPANTGGSSIIWAQDAEFDTPITPERRYLMVAASMASNTTGGFASGRGTELAIVVIPEPSQYAFLIGALVFGGLMLRRIRS